LTESKHANGDWGKEAEDGLTALTENFTAERTKAVITRRKQDEMLIGKAEAN
jgi:hypothetical protein